MPPAPRTLDLATPCTMAWEAMSGSARVRFCTACSKQVYNLSALTEEEAAAVLAMPTTACVAYQPAPDGSVRYAPSGFWEAMRRRFDLAVVRHLPVVEAPPEPPPRVGGLRR